MDNSYQNLLQQYLNKQGINKNYQQAEIVLVKLGVDRHPWPVKIASFFLQQLNPKQKKKSSSQQSYNPDQKKQKRINRISKNKKKIQLIYKVKYYEWQYFAFVSQNQIKPYTLKSQRQLLMLNDKKLQKAIQKARFQMTIEQRQKLQKQLIEVKKGVQIKLSSSYTEYKKAKSNNEKSPKKRNYVANKVFQNKELEQKVSKKQLKNIKKLNKSMIVEAKSKIDKNKQNFSVLLPNLSIQSSVFPSLPQFIQTNDPSQNNSIISEQDRHKVRPDIIKQQYREQGQDKILSAIYQSSCSQSQNEQGLQNGKQIVHQYILDGILYKNKFQILGILSDLLQDFLSKMLWIQPSRKQSQIITHQIRKRINTLNKILSVQIFNFQELSRSRCLQKMLNIIRIGEIIDFSNQRQIPLSIRNKLQKTYFLIITILKKLKQSKSANLENIQRSNRKEVLQFINLYENRLETKTKSSISIIKDFQISQQGSNQCSEQQTLDKSINNLNTDKSQQSLNKTQLSLSKQSLKSATKRSDTITINKRFSMKNKSFQKIQKKKQNKNQQIQKKLQQSNKFIKSQTSKNDKISTRSKNKNDCQYKKVKLNCLVFDQKSRFNVSLLPKDDN